MRPKRFKQALALAFFGAVLASLFSYRHINAEVNATSALSREELESQIKKRTQDLESINKQLQETENNLAATKSQSLTLNHELRILDGNISHLNLNIKADELTKQKLGLEIDSLNYDIRDIELSIDNKRGAIEAILTEFQKNDQSSPLIVFLKNKSLADSVLEAQSLRNIRSQLSLDIAGLGKLHEELNGKVKEVSGKKENVELHQKNLSNRKLIVQDQKEERKTLLAQTKNKESLYESQRDVLKKQQDAIADEIAKIEDQLRANFDVSILPTKRPGVFSWPIQLPEYGGQGRITQHFGERSYLYGGKPHNGLDISAPIGTPVLAADDGVVMAVDDNDRSAWARYQYGKYILIRHANNLATLYAHLSRQIVFKGQTVHKGDLIGYSGKTGYATGPHLHFGAYWAPSIVMKYLPPALGLVPVGVAINPEDYL